MPLLTAGLQEILVLTGTSHTTLRSQRRRGTAVAAFGTSEPLLDTRWLLIDGLAMLIRDDLTRSGMAMQVRRVKVRRGIRPSEPNLAARRGLYRPCQKLSG
jgi:hypothetical protein